MMKILITAIIIVGSFAHGKSEEPKKTEGPTVTYQVAPGTTSRDWTKPLFMTQGNVTYQVKPGTTGRDWTAPSLETRNGDTYQVARGTSSGDWPEPSFWTDTT